MGKIRWMYFRGKLSLHQIAKRTGLSRNTIRKWGGAPEVNKLGPFAPRVPVCEKIRRCRLGFVPRSDNVLASLSIRENHHVGEYYQSKEDNQRCIGPCLMSELTTVLGIIPVAG